MCDRWFRSAGKGSSGKGRPSAEGSQQLALAAGASPDTLLNVSNCPLTLVHLTQSKKYLAVPVPH